MTHHSILSYQERLYGYLEQLALQRSTSAAATLPGGQRAASRDGEDPASLFRQAPSPGAGDNPLLDEVGRFAGKFELLSPAYPGFMGTKTEERCSTPSHRALLLAVHSNKPMGRPLSWPTAMLRDSGSMVLKHG